MTSLKRESQQLYKTSLERQNIILKQKRQTQMAPSGFAIIIGAGPTSGRGIARVLARADGGNLAVALLARNADNLNNLRDGLREETNGCWKKIYNYLGKNPSNMLPDDSFLMAHTVSYFSKEERIGNIS